METMETATVVVLKFVDEESGEFRFSFSFGSEVTLIIGYCTHCEDEIQPLLNGENYEYGDRGFYINQKDGLTEFSFKNYSSFKMKITVPHTKCAEALKYWVNESEKAPLLFGTRK